jgi:hypothetical protein
VIVHTCDQRTPEWFALRAGRITGSVAGDMLATLKGKGEAAARRDLKIAKAVERVTGVPLEDGDGYTSPAMQRGVDKEATARGAYETETGNLVRVTGFLTHETLMAGASLDGDVDDFTGVIEIKCPKPATHIATLRAGVVPAIYIPQITHALWLTGAQWCDFVSFDDRFPQDLALFIARVHRDEAAIASYELALRLFLSEIEAEMKDIQTMRAQKVQAA